MSKASVLPLTERPMARIFKGFFLSPAATLAIIIPVDPTV